MYSFEFCKRCNRDTDHKEGECVQCATVDAIDAYLAENKLREQDTHVCPTCHVNQTTLPDMCLECLLRVS